MAATADGVDCAADTCGVITYAAGGAVNAAHELFVPLTFGATEPTEPAGGTITGARLEWGLKESFRDYVRGGIAHGGWALTGVTGDGPFRWTDLTAGEFDQRTGGLLDFAGSVRFTGHDQGAGPLLDLTISQPRFRVADGVAELLLDVRSKGLENPNEFVELDDAVFATLDLASVTPTVTNGVISYPAVPATLTAEGATGFAGFYEAGTALDPVTVAIALDGATLPPPGAGGGTTIPTTPVANTLADTGTDIGPPLAAGALLVLLGTGLLIVRRPRATTIR